MLQLCCPVAVVSAVLLARCKCASSVVVRGALCACRSSVCRSRRQLWHGRARAGPRQVCPQLGHARRRLGVSVFGRRRRGPLRPRSSVGRARADGGGSTETAAAAGVRPCMCSGRHTPRIDFVEAGGRQLRSSAVCSSFVVCVGCSASSAALCRRRQLCVPCAVTVVLLVFVAEMTCFLQCCCW